MLIELHQIARAVLFGKSATNNIDNAVTRARSTYVRLDIPAKTTFGMLSWIATIVSINCPITHNLLANNLLNCIFHIQTRYTLSKDLAFDSVSGVGRQTGIRYAEDYCHYKQYLINGMESNPDWVKQLLAIWDCEVFAKHNKEKGNNTEENAETDNTEGPRPLDVSSEIERDMHLLQIQNRQGMFNSTVLIHYMS